MKRNLLVMVLILALVAAFASFSFAKDQHPVPVREAQLRRDKTEMEKLSIENEVVRVDVKKYKETYSLNFFAKLGIEEWKLVATSLRDHLSSPKEFFELEIFAKLPDKRIANNKIYFSQAKKINQNAIQLLGSGMLEGVTYSVIRTITLNSEMRSVAIYDQGRLSQPQKFNVAYSIRFIPEGIVGAGGIYFSYPETDRRDSRRPMRDYTTKMAVIPAITEADISHRASITLLHQDESSRVGGFTRITRKFGIEGPCLVALLPDLMQEALEGDHWETTWYVLPLVWDKVSKDDYWYSPILREAHRIYFKKAKLPAIDRSIDQAVKLGVDFLFNPQKIGQQYGWWSKDTNCGFRSMLGVSKTGGGVHQSSKHSGRMVWTGGGRSNGANDYMAYGILKYLSIFGNNKELKRKCYQILDTPIKMGAQDSQLGAAWTIYDPETDRWYGSWKNPDTESGFGTYQVYAPELMSLSGYYHLLAYQLAKTTWDDEQRQWLNYAQGIGDFIVKSQEKNGSISRFFDKDGKPVGINKYSMNTMFSVPLLVELSKVTQEGKYLIAARESADYVIKEHINKNVGTETGQDWMFWGCETTDNLKGINDSLCHLIALPSLLDLYEVTNEQKYLNAAKRTGIDLLRWFWYYQGPYKNIVTRGGMRVMWCRGEVIDSRQLWAPLPLMRLYRYTGEKIFADFAGAALQAGLRMQIDQEWNEWCKAEIAAGAVNENWGQWRLLDQPSYVDDEYLLLDTGGFGVGALITEFISILDQFGHVYINAAIPEKPEVTVLDGTKSLKVKGGIASLRLEVDSKIVPTIVKVALPDKPNIVFINDKESTYQWSEEGIITIYLSKGENEIRIKL